MPLTRPPRCPRGLRARLLLEDGTRVEGCGFGATGTRVGEVVFTTNMVGYPEALTDPSFRGQVLVYTHPMVGNYGVPDPSIRVHGIPAHYESDRVQVEGFIVTEETVPHHWASVKTLHEWLREENVPGMSRVDTRALVKKLREQGVMMGVLSVYPEGEEPEWEELREVLEKSPRYDEQSFVDQVSPRAPITHRPEGIPVRHRVSMLDCGVKYGILRNLVSRGFEVTRFPCNTPPEKLVDGFEGVVLSNGPGNPALLEEQVEIVKGLLEYRVPILAICLGNQLLALAHGARIFKLKYGHRGPNKPVVDVETGRCYITTQNHGYAVDIESLRGTGLRLWFINPDDKTLEGFRHERLPIVSTQFHPEASPGPWDTRWVFDLYSKVIERSAGW